MGYTIDQIQRLQAIVIPTRIRRADYKYYNISNQADFNEIIKYKKADAQIRLVIIIGDVMCIENISIKKSNDNANYNQVDKRPVNTYQEMWHFSDVISDWLKLFTGEIIPSESRLLTDIDRIKEPNKRIYFTEMPWEISEMIIEFFTLNKIRVVSDILKGRGALSANWLLVTRTSTDGPKWILKEMNEAMNFLGQGEVAVSPRGSLKIGRITMQRKGGTPDPTSLQFKIPPCDLFDMD